MDYDAWIDLTGECEAGRKSRATVAAIEQAVRNEPDRAILRARLIGRLWADWSDRPSGPPSRLAHVLYLIEQHPNVFLGFLGLVFPDERPSYDRARQLWIRAARNLRCAAVVKNACYWLARFSLDDAVDVFAEFVDTHPSVAVESAVPILNDLSLTSPPQLAARRIARSLGRLALRQDGSESLAFHARQWAHLSGQREMRAALTLAVDIMKDRGLSTAKRALARLLIGHVLSDSRTEIDPLCELVRSSLGSDDRSIRDVQERMRSLGLSDLVSKLDVR